MVQLIHFQFPGKDKIGKQIQQVSFPVLKKAVTHIKKIILLKINLEIESQDMVGS